MLDFLLSDTLDDSSQLFCSLSLNFSLSDV